KLNFPEMREEFDASQKVKREAKILVIVGNPPYDRFTGAAQDGVIWLRHEPRPGAERSGCAAPGLGV
ncbi:MAG: hypothetical protein M3N43_02140, partial [Actinomycetota bacterium]|nr:hypothetical protein [Actinomycetota bacterium]